MSEVVENVSEKNSAQSKEAAAAPTEAVEDITTNNVEDAKAVPEAVETVSSATTGNADDSASKASPEGSSASPKVDSKKTPVSTLQACSQILGGVCFKVRVSN